ncbi:hypothetical protein ACE1SV_03210 [Streptomyces sp. E-15]
MAEVGGQDAADLSDPFGADFHVEVVVAGHCGLHRRLLLTGEALAPLARPERFRTHSVSGSRF